MKDIGINWARQPMAIKMIFREDIKPAGSLLYPWGLRDYLE